MVLLLAAAVLATGLDERAVAVVDLLHDLRLEQAATAAAGLRRDFPGHPAGPFYQSLVHYQRALLDHPPPPAEFEAYRKFQAETEAACEAIRAKDPAAAERYLGAAKGFHARLLGAAGERGRALKEARRAIGHLEKALELNPADDDARLGLGLYHYFMSRVPAFAKPFVFLVMGSGGNRELGLEMLKKAANSKGPSRMEALAVLAAIYSSRREKRWKEAEDILDVLIERYPGNPFFRLKAAVAASWRGDYDKARRLADPESGWIEKVHPLVRERTRAEAKRRVEEAAGLKAGTIRRPARLRWPFPKA